MVLGALIVSLFLCYFITMMSRVSWTCFSLKLLSHPACSSPQAAHVPTRVYSFISSAGCLEEKQITSLVPLKGEKRWEEEPGPFLLLLPYKWQRWSRCVWWIDSYNQIDVYFLLTIHFASILAFVFIHVSTCEWPVAKGKANLTGH